MTYVPHTDAERQEMLARIGVGRIEDLFESVPAANRFPQIDLPEPVSELEIMDELRSMAEENDDLQHYPSFLGAGAYNHFVPSVVSHITGRSEFYTAYTPYQPEMSQGTLQSIFEYQTMICDLTGMAVSNASHYDGATSLAEGVLMALAVSRGRRNRVVLARTVHPEYRETVRTYSQGLNLDIVGDDVPRDLRVLLDLVDEKTACLVVQNPDFLGRILDLNGLAEQVHARGALLIVVCDPISLGMLKAPGAYGADIALGEGQSLGSPLNYGGPYLGFFTCTQEHVRRMAGRLVGQTVDGEGRTGYVLTLATREQHIRREKATSNICTNQGLVALAAAVYLAAMGKCGLAKVANLCYQRAHYAASRIGSVTGYEVDTTAPFFQEFVVRCPMPAGELNQVLLGDYDIVGGYDLSVAYPELDSHMLFCVTEMNTVSQIEELVEALEEINYG
jgi:glycine dehydrogenase subunit 1